MRCQLIGLILSSILLGAPQSLAQTPPVAAPPPTPDPAAGPATPVTAPSAASTGKPEEHAVSAELQSYVEPFLYDLKDRKDPFKPFVETDGGSSAEGDFEGPLLPLQRYDIDEIRLIGIIWDVREPKAMFMDPNSQIHILSREERIGKNNGYLAVIREGEVVIIENIKAKGEMIRSPRVLKISR